MRRKVFNLRFIHRIPLLHLQELVVVTYDLVQQILNKEVSAMNNILNLKDSFISSFKELRNTRSLTGLSMLIALSIVVSYITSFQITPTLKIGIGFLVTALMGMLYGPVAAGLANGLANLIKFFLKPTGPFFLGYTITAILGGVIYGIFFYKGKCSLWRAISAKTCVNIFLNVCLNTYWGALLYGDAMSAIIGPRFIKNISLLPFEIVLLYIVLMATKTLLSKTKGIFYVSNF